MSKGSILRIFNPTFTGNTELVEAYIVRSQTTWFAMAKDAKNELGQDWGTPPEMRFHDDAIEMWFPWKTPEEMWEVEVKICSIAVSMMLETGASAASAPIDQKMPCHSIQVLRNISWNYTIDDLLVMEPAHDPSKVSTQSN